MKKVNRYVLGTHVLGGQPCDLDDLELVPLPNDDEIVAQAIVEAADAVVAAPSPASAPQFLPSEIEGVSDEAWTAWVQAMKVAEPTTIADNGSIGMFAMKPRRLADLGLMTKVHKTTGKKKKVAMWTGDWVEPMTQEEFLRNPQLANGDPLQYAVLVASTRLYADALADGTIAWNPIANDPDDVELTLSGALALLHKCGPKGLEGWSTQERMPSTVALVERTNGLF